MKITFEKFDSSDNHETNETSKDRSTTPPTAAQLSYSSQTSTPASMTYEPNRTSPFSYMLSSANNNVISHVPR